MSNETKRDVFVRLAEDLKINDSFDEEYPKSREDIEKEYKENIHNYDSALPDDMPVIPEYVADYIVYWKEQNNSLIDIALESAHTRMDSDDSSEAFDWVHNHFEKFSRAWVLGVWRVEKTGEIAKLGGGEMKREIKFRAWAKVHECYLYDVQGAYDTLSGWVKYENGEDADYDEECFDDFLDNEQYIVEQYTGLHDKNGKSIYEGDIVRYTAWHDGEPTGVFKGEVVYSGDLGMASFNIRLDHDGEIDRAVLPAIGVEVIGNIHENMELLEVDE